MIWRNLLTTVRLLLRCICGAPAVLKWKGAPSHPCTPIHDWPTSQPPHIFRSSSSKVFSQTRKLFRASASSEPGHLPRFLFQGILSDEEAILSPCVF